MVGTESLTRDILEDIWGLVPAMDSLHGLGPVACSFQGSGTRTRTTFFQAVQQLGLQAIELPPFLDTRERVQDLSGYLDPFYSLYVIRYRDHEKLEDFAGASKRPVIKDGTSPTNSCRVSCT